MDTHGDNFENGAHDDTLIGNADIWPVDATEPEEMSFFAQLREFYKKRQTLYTEDWSLGTTQIDPQKFFELVCNVGGFFAANELMAWSQLLKFALGSESYQSAVLELTEATLVNTAMNLYWAKLYAFEYVHFESKPDSGVDFTKVHFTDPNLASYLPGSAEEMDEKSPHSNQGLLAPQTPLTIGSGTQNAPTFGTGEENTDDLDMDEDSSAGEELQMKRRVSRLARTLTAKNVRLNPRALMEAFLIRPEHGRPLTWRHQTDANANLKLLAVDFTKTPIPKASTRLMGRQRETLLMRRIERAFNDDTSEKDCASALTALQTRAWSKAFFIALYPTLLDSLLRFTRFLLDRLQISSIPSHLFNFPPSEAESDLALLLRVSIILRNLSHAPHNLNLLASHAQIAPIITKFINLRKSLGNRISELKPISSRSLGEIHTVCSALNGINGEIMMELRGRMDEMASENESRDSASCEPLKVIQQLKSNLSLEHLASIQFNALEVLTGIVNLVKLAPNQNLFPQPWSQTSGAEAALSEQGQSIMECLPTLIEIVVNPTSKSTTVFLAVESIAKLAMNSNSHHMWQMQSPLAKAELIETLVRFAMLEDELADWSIFAAVHLALNAMDVAVAQGLASNEQFLNDLMLMMTNYATLPKTTADQMQNVLYRRHQFATRSATILHRLVEFVPLNAYLLSYERAIADIYMHAPPELSNPFYRVFVEMQTWSTSL